MDVGFANGQPHRGRIAGPVITDRDLRVGEQMDGSVVETVRARVLLSA
jgi:hypothetical protein